MVFAVHGFFIKAVLVDEVAARSVGAVAVDPVLLAVLGLVFVVSHNILLKLRMLHIKDYD